MTSLRWLLASVLVAGLGASARADHVDWGPFLEKPGDKVTVFKARPADKPAPAAVAEAPAKKPAKAAKVAKHPAAPKAKARKAKGKH